MLLTTRQIEQLRESLFALVDQGNYDLISRQELDALCDMARMRRSMIDFHGRVVLAIDKLDQEERDRIDEVGERELRRKGKVPHG